MIRRAVQWLASHQAELSEPASSPPPPPPPCPHGWLQAPPDFVGVGAQRSGTSWWFSLLASHPRVALAPGASKEVHYFEQFLIRPLPPGAAAGYSRHFPRPPGSLAGEWTPRYMHDVWTPPLLQQLAPAARLLVMLRDPVDRYRSGCAHELAKAGAAPLQFVAGDAFARGLYHLQLQRLLRHFGRGDVLVLQFEACLRSTARELTRTFAFLGLEDDVTVPARAVARVNAAVGGKPPLADGLRAALVDAYRNDVDRLLGSFPEIDGDLWPNMCSSASRKP